MSSQNRRTFPCHLLPGPRFTGRGEGSRAKPALWNLPLAELPGGRAKVWGQWQGQGQPRDNLMVEKPRCKEQKRLHQGRQTASASPHRLTLVTASVTSPQARIPDLPLCTYMRSFNHF